VLRSAGTYLNILAILLVISLPGSFLLLDWNGSDSGRIGQAMVFIHLAVWFSVLAAFPITFWYRKRRSAKRET
jgi:hypothetical protein